MIDLDALEQAAAEPQVGWQGEVWEVVDQETLAALVRAVRAAEMITDWRHYSADYAAPKLVVEHREDWDALDAALAPFRPEQP